MTHSRTLSEVEAAGRHATRQCRRCNGRCKRSSSFVRARRGAARAINVHAGGHLGSSTLAVSSLTLRRYSRGGSNHGRCTRAWSRLRRRRCNRYYALSAHGCSRRTGASVMASWCTTCCGSTRGLARTGGAFYLGGCTGTCGSRRCSSLRAVAGIAIARGVAITVAGYSSGDGERRVFARGSVGYGLL